MITEPFTLTSSEGAVLHGLLDLPDHRPEPQPTIVVAHGFKGFMEWGFFTPLAELLASRGLAVVRFNFSGTGVLPGEDRVSDLEAFRRNTPSRERDELLTILGALGKTIAPGRIDPNRIGLFGHSRGGGAALLASAHAPWNERLRALVTWAAVATYDRIGLEEKTEWRRRGEVIIVNGRTGQELPIGVELLDDLERNAESLDLEKAAAARRAPWLILHGTEDPTVPIAEARRLKATAADLCRLHEIEGAGHTFGAVHPFSGPTRNLIEAMNATQTWFRRHLRG